MSEKWALSTDEENYCMQFGTKEEALKAAKEFDGCQCWIGKCIPPEQPEELFDESAVGDWLDRVWSHDDYLGEWAEESFAPTRAQCQELAKELRPVIAAWLDRNKLRPMHWNIDPASVIKVQQEDRDE